MSISIFILLVIYATALGSVLINRRGTQKSKSSTRKNVSSDPEPYIINRDNLGFAFVFREYGSNFFFDPSYLNVEILQTAIDMSDITNVVRQSINRPFEK